MDSSMEIFRQSCLESGLIQDAPMIMIADGKVRQRNLLALRMFSNAIDIASRPIGEAMQKVSTEPVPTALCKGIVSEIGYYKKATYVSVYMAEPPTLFGGMQEMIGGTVETLGQLYDLEQESLREVYRGFLAEVNACLLCVYGGGSLPLQVNWPDIEPFSSSGFLARVIRKHLYQHVRTLTGIDLSAMAHAEESTRMAREGAFRTYCEHVAPAQQEYEKKGRIRYLITGSVYYPEHTFFRRLAISDPGGYFNSIVSRAIQA
jgi:hypothetical protein